MLKEIFGAVLNKGGAGTSLSRADTIARLNPVIVAHTRLLHAYDAARAGRPAAETDRIDALLRTARMDVGKLAENVFSLGGTPYNGTDIEPGTTVAEAGGEARYRALAQAEEAFARQLDDELAVDHQIRVGATLGILRAHSQERLDAVRDFARRATD